MIDLAYIVRMYADGKHLADVKLPEWSFVADCLDVCKKQGWGVLVFDLHTDDCVEARGALPEGWGSVPW